MCDVTKCKKYSSIQYAAFETNKNKCVSVCDYHWQKHCDEKDKFNLKTHFYPVERKKYD